MLASIGFGYINANVSPAGGLGVIFDTKAIKSNFENFIAWNKTLRPLLDNKLLIFVIEK